MLYGQSHLPSDNGSFMNDLSTRFDVRIPMRNLCVEIVIVLALLWCAGSSSAQSRFTPDARLRTRFSINDAWKFAPGDVNGAETVAFNDSEWAAVNLPHTWNAQDAFDDTPGYRRGAGWYRKSLYLDSALQGKRLFLYF